MYKEEKVKDLIENKKSWYKPLREFELWSYCFSVSNPFSILLVWCWGWNSADHISALPAAATCWALAMRTQGGHTRLEEGEGMFFFFCGLVSISCSCEQHANNAFQPSRGSSFQGQNLNPVCNFSLPCRTHLNVLFQHQHWSASTPSAEVWVSISLIPPLSL